jgi:predicted metal-binding membrane protein
MPGQTWLGAASSFVGMWFVMMMAMMLRTARVAGVVVLAARAS